MTRKTECAVRVDEQVLSLRTSPRSQLIALWAAFFGSRPPKNASRDLLCRALAWEIQAGAHGNLRPVIKRQLSTIRDGALSTSMNRSGRSAIKPGATLLREWRGRMHSVSVKEDGFEYDGRPFRSLSHIAKEITGGHRSGPRFFGLKGRLSPNEQL